MRHMLRGFMPIMPIILSTLALAGCQGGACRQADVRALQVGVTDRLNAVDVGYLRPGLMYAEGSTVIAGDDGLVLMTLDGASFVASRPVAANLYAVAFGPSDRVFVAGAGGTLLRGTFGGDEWVQVPLTTTADLWAVEWISVGTAYFDGAANTEFVLAAGDDVVVVRDPVDEGWDAAPAPEGGWGALRTIVGGRRIHVAGLGGALWAADEASGAWTRQDVGADDLLAGGIGWTGEALLVGARGTLLEATASGTWKRWDTGIAEDLIGYGEWGALAADGRVYDVVSPDEPVVQAWSLPGARAIASDSEYVVVGAGGSAARIDMYCE